jgi:hypothetical protein
MSRIFILFGLVLLSSVSKAQTERQLVLQEALDLPQFNEHAKRQILFDFSEELSYTLPIDQKGPAVKLKFLKYELAAADLTSTEPMVVVNFDFEKVQIKESKARVKYSFYPFWKVCEETGPSPAFSNGLYMEIDVRLVKEEGKWVVASSKIKDMDFKFSEGIPGYGCLKRHYIPF